MHGSLYSARLYGVHVEHRLSEENVPMHEEKVVELPAEPHELVNETDVNGIWAGQGDRGVVREHSLRALG